MSFFSLICLSLVMFAGSYFIGLLPLSLSLSGRGQKFLSSYGIGLLIGTALIVIIPEGIQNYQTGECQNYQNNLLNEHNENQNSISSHSHPHSSSSPQISSSRSSVEFSPDFDFTAPIDSAEESNSHTHSHSHSDHSSLSPI